MENRQRTASKSSMVCHQRTFCGFIGLRNGVYSVAVFCTIVAIVNIAITAKRGSLLDTNETDELYYAGSIVTVSMSILMIVFSILLIIGAKKDNINLIWPWVAFAFVYISYRFLQLGLRVYYASMISRNETEVIQIVSIIVDSSFCAFFSYCIVVVCSYKTDLKDQRQRSEP